MRRLATLPLTIALIAALTLPAAADTRARSIEVRFATFNPSLNRFNAGDLINDLFTPNNAQARAVAEIIQRTRPDVLLINEFDFDPNGTAAVLFQENYLGVSQNGAEPIH